MELKAKKKISTMAVVMDQENETAEAVKVDTLRMMSFVINYATKAMQVAFAWGGYDSEGKFHMDPHMPAAHRALNSNVDGERELFEQLCYDETGNPLEYFDQAFFLRLLDAELAGRSIIRHVVDGGWPIEELELSHKGKPVLSKKKHA